MTNNVLLALCNDGKDNQALKPRGPHGRAGMGKNTALLNKLPGKHIHISHVTRKYLLLRTTERGGVNSLSSLTYGRLIFHDKLQTGIMETHPPNRRNA